MNVEQTGAVLAKIAAVDNRNDTDVAILAWHEAIGDLDFGDTLNAVAEHRRTSSEYLMPVHVRRLAEQFRRERHEQALQAERRLQLDAYAAESGPLTDRSQEIQGFVKQVRDTLPEGDIEALQPRREQWRREHTAYVRQATAEPNPMYDPAMGPIPIWQASKHPPAGAWWEDEAKREAHSRELLDAAGRLHRHRPAREETS